MEEQEQNGVTPPKAIAINCAKNFDFPPYTKKIYKD
jgi:hypothetical protein